MARYRNPEIEPDEILSDTLNMPGFREEQFEGRIERPISKVTVIVLGLAFLFVGIIYAGKSWSLQVSNGGYYAALSGRNHLRHLPIFSERGVIYDRNKKELAWNVEKEEFVFSGRKYAPVDGIAHIIGYVSPPKLDSSGRFWQTESIGMDGVEKSYNARLGGENGVNIVETDAKDNVLSESVVKPPLNGGNIILTIDSRVNEKMYRSVASLAESVGFTGGAGVIMNVKNGELLALVSYPEYSSAVLSEGGEGKKIESYINDKRMPFLNRAVSGLYTPGSVVKPYMALGALTEGIISPEKKILSTGSISIPNPYNPDKPSIFKDWKAHGWVDMREALSVSSDVYFYVIGGGFEGQKGLGIANIKKYAEMFGLGRGTGIDLPAEADGVVPDEKWKAENFNGEEWLIGDTYHTAIGQYGFQVTPIEMARAVSAVANGGTLVSPHITLEANAALPRTLSINPEHFKTVQEGMRRGVNGGGTAKGLDMAGVKVAAKTGTAELGAKKDFVNSWVTGFFPYDDPKYAFVVVMEKGPVGNTMGGVYVMRQVLEWMEANTPEYLK